MDVNNQTAWHTMYRCYETISISRIFIDLNIKAPKFDVTYISSFDMIKMNFVSFNIVSKCMKFSAHARKRKFLSFSYRGHVLIK